MSQSVAPNPQADVDRLEAATDESDCSVRGDVRERAQGASSLRMSFWKTEVCELMQAVSHAYVEGSGPIPAALESPGARNMAEVTYYVARRSLPAMTEWLPASRTECFNPTPAVMRAEAALSRRGPCRRPVAFSRTEVIPATCDSATQGDQEVRRRARKKNDLSAL